jgi:ArsR family transcriptional regulator, cadmium/lead-responsive transcriptional repressor
MAKHAAQRAAMEGEADELHAKFVRGLADVTRLRIVRYLLDGPRSVGEIVLQLGVPQSRISNQLACLKWCGYVTTQRDGRSIIYRITDDRVREVLRLTRAIVGDNATRIASCIRIPEQ